MKRRLILTAVSLLVISMFFIWGMVSGLFHRWLVARGLVYPSWEECAQVMGWAAERLPAGAESELPLPPSLKKLSCGGVIQAIRSENARTCVLIKRTIGWKGNFTGTLCCGGPLAPDEIVHGAYPSADYISLRGSAYFNELYVARRLGENWFRVYFDLN